MGKCKLPFFAEHHGKGRNDGQFGLQRKWIESFVARQTISSLQQLLDALKDGAAGTMQADPPPSGPSYEVAHFHPSKPRQFQYLDISGLDFKVEYTYCVFFRKTENKKYPVMMRKYIYSDRLLKGEHVEDLGAARIINKESAEEWRVSYRQDEPEKEPLPESLLRRRLDHQRHVKSREPTSRRSSDLERMLALENARKRKQAKAKRERQVFACSSDSSSGSSSSSSSSSNSGAR